MGTHKQSETGTTRHLWLALLFMYSMSASPAWANGAFSPSTEPDITGRALDPLTGQLLYLEQHFCTDSGELCQVYYRDPEGQVFANKTMDYSFSLQAPTLFFHDLRFDREFELAPQRLDWVVDSGFDNYVRSQWDPLLAGETLRFPLKLISREEPIKMKARRQQQGCAEDRVCFEVALNSWLLGKLVDPIALEYDPMERRLLRFGGISNILNAEGRSQVVDIRYQYRGSSSDLAVIPGVGEE